MINAERLRRDVAVIAASAGGVKALIELFSRLSPGRAGAIGVVIHRSPTFESHLAQVLQRATRLTVVEPEGGEAIRSGTVYLAPPDRHMVVEGGRLAVHRGPKQHYTRPAADPLFLSAARAFGPRVLGVVLSGGGADGTLGCIEIKKLGGLVVVQDEREAVMPYMPRSSLLHHSVDAVLPLAEIAGVIAELAAGNSVETNGLFRAKPS